MYRKAEGTVGSKRKAMDPSAASGSGASHGSAPALPRLQREADHLRARLEECQGSLDASNQSVRLLQSQLSDSEAGRRSAEQVLEKLRSTSGKEIKRLRRDKEALEARLQAVAEDAEGALGEVRAADERKIEELKHKNKTLRERVRELTKQLAMGGGGGAGRSGTRAGAAHRRTGRVLSRGRSPRVASRSRGSAARRPSSRSGRSVTSVGSARSGASRRAGSVASRRSASTAGSRASSRGRFDPTEYVRRKKQALEDRKRSRGRLPMVAGSRTKARTRGPTTPSRQPAAAAVSPALSRRSGASRASGRSARSSGTAGRRRVRAAAGGATPGSTASGRSGRSRGGGVTRTGGTARGSGYGQRPSTAGTRARPAKRRAGPSPYGTGPMRVPANRGRGGSRPRSSGGPLSAKEARQRLKAAVASGSQGRSYRARPWAEGSEATGRKGGARSRSGSRGGRQEEGRGADDGVHDDRGMGREEDALRRSAGSGFGMDTTDPAAALRAADAVLSAGPSPDLAVSGGGYGAGRGTRRGQGGRGLGHRGGQSGGIAEPPVVPRQAWVDPEEQQQRQHEEAQAAGGRGGGIGRASDPSGTDGHSAPPQASRTQQEGDGSGAGEPGAAGHGAEDSAGNDATASGGGLHNEVSSIDDRLRKLQDFLKAAKEGKPVELPQ